MTTSPNAAGVKSVRVSAPAFVPRTCSQPTAAVVSSPAQVPRVPMEAKAGNVPVLGSCAVNMMVPAAALPSGKGPAPSATPRVTFSSTPRVRVATASGDAPEPSQVTGLAWAGTAVSTSHAVRARAVAAPAATRPLLKAPCMRPSFRVVAAPGGPAGAGPAYPRAGGRSNPPGGLPPDTTTGPGPGLPPAGAGGPGRRAGRAPGRR